MGSLTVGRCDRILQKILEEVSISKSTPRPSGPKPRLRVCVRDDALRSNPVREVPRLPRAAMKEPTPTTEQLNSTWELIQDWRLTRADGPQTNYRILIDGTETMLGTSIRIGECDLRCL